MQVLKALFFLLFVVHRIYCDDGEGKKLGVELEKTDDKTTDLDMNDAKEDEPLEVEMSDEEANKLEDAPEEDKDEEQADEEADEEEHEDEEDSQDVEQQENGKFDFFFPFLTM